MRALNSKGPDGSALVAFFVWLGSHLAQVSVAIQCLLGLVSIVALIYAARYHAVKRRALERWIENGGKDAPP